VTDFEILGQLGWAFTPANYISFLAGYAPSGVDRNYEISIIIPEGFAFLGQNPLTASMRGLFGPLLYLIRLPDSPILL